MKENYESNISAKHIRNEYEYLKIILCDSNKDEGCLINENNFE